MLHMFSRDHFPHEKNCHINFPIQSMCWLEYIFQRSSLRTRTGERPNANQALAALAKRDSGDFFFRPTPYGFRQVVQHVSNHVACEIN